MLSVLWLKYLIVPNTAGIPTSVPNERKLTLGSYSKATTVLCSIKIAEYFIKIFWNKETHTIHTCICIYMHVLYTCILYIHIQINTCVYIHILSRRMKGMSNFLQILYFYKALHIFGKA